MGDGFRGNDDLDVSVADCSMYHSCTDGSFNDFEGKGMSEEKFKELGIYSPQEALAKAIIQLGGDKKEDRVKLFSNLKKIKDVFRYALIYNVGDELGLDWLNDFADNCLKLMVSLDKGRGRRDIVEVAKQPAIGMVEGLKERIKSFVRSE